MTRKEVPIEDVRLNPNNPRQNVRESKIDELAASIDSQGLLQQPLIRPVDDGYELVHGERRLRAVRSLGWDTIPANVEEMDDADALEVSITENLQREDVTPIGEAHAYRMLIDEHGITQTEAADQLGVSQSEISNKLRLLDLPDRLKDSILRKILSPWQAQELARAWEDYWLYDLTLDWDLSVREIRRLIDELQNGDEQVRFTRAFSAAELDGYWGEPPDDIDGSTTVVSSDGERVVDRVMHMDGRGSPVEQIHETDSPHGILWGSRTLEDYPVEVREDIYEEFKTPPIRLHWPGQKILVGYHRLSLAELYDYDGAFEVELCYPAEFFDSDRRRTADFAREGSEAPAPDTSTEEVDG